MAQGYGEMVSLVGRLSSSSAHIRFQLLTMSSVEQDNITALRAANEGSSVSTPVTEAEKQLYLWIQAQYHSGSSFKVVSGFIGWKKFQKVLVAQKPQQRDQIISALGQ
jgi:hypothetical protein